MDNNELNNTSTVANDLESSIEGKAAENYDEVIKDSNIGNNDEAENAPQVKVVTPEEAAKKIGEQKYRVARGSLLIVVILSIINLFSLIFTQSYFLFSSYITFMFGATGYDLYTETGDALVVVVIAVLGIISVLPYLACWIFSKKKVGWLIAALVLFAVDTLLLLFDTIASGGSFIIDLAIHGYFIYEMVVAVKYGLKKKKEEQESIESL